MYSKAMGPAHRCVRHFVIDVLRRRTQERPQMLVDHAVSTAP
jgi:hypothetical protein